MFPQEFSGGEISDHDGESLTADLVIAAGEKNSAWFRCFVISIIVFKSHNKPHHDDHDHDVRHHDDEHEEVPPSSPEQAVPADHVIYVRDNSDEAQERREVSEIDELVRIVKERDLKALRRLGGVDWAESLQRSHFEAMNRDGHMPVQDPKEYWKSAKGRGFLYFLIQAFNNCPIILLLISAALLFGIEMFDQGAKDGWHEGVAVVFAIFILVMFSSVGNFMRERKAVKKLLKEKKEKVIVERNGTSLSLFVPQIMVWDTLSLVEGDQIPADGLIVTTESLTLDEVKDSVIDRFRNPFLVCGSRVVQGRGSMIVTSVRSNESLVDEIRSPSEDNFLQSLLQKPYEYIEMFVLSMSVLIAIVVLIRPFLTKKHSDFHDVPDMKGQLTMKMLMEIFERLFFKPQGRVSILVSVLVTLVVGVQHGMPFLIGCCLRHWRNKLSHGSLHLQNLSACCTMALVDVVIVDATQGDLLHKETKVKHFWIGEKDITVENSAAFPLEVLGSIMRKGAGVWDYWPKISDTPNDGVHVSWETSKWGSPDLRERSKVVEYRRTSSSGKKDCEVLLREVYAEEKSLYLHWKGPPLSILDMCSHFYDCFGEKHAIGCAQRTMFSAQIKDMETKNCIPIAFAYSQTDVKEIKREGLNLLAIVGLNYTCMRGDVKLLVGALTEVGLAIKLVSEDELSSMKYIASELGFAGSCLNGMSIEAGKLAEVNIEEMEKLLEGTTIMGNSRPQDKFLMVEKLQENDHIVAFVGGLSTTDIPTHRKADLSMAQESRCIEMVKCVTDILIKTPHLLTLKQLRYCGRSMYGNIQKFFQVLLTYWISGLIITIISTIQSGDCPLTSPQMIWVNFMLCILCGLMMVMDLDKDDRPLKRSQLLVTKAMWESIAIQVSCQVLLFVFFYYLIGTRYATAKTERDILDTMVFNTFALCQIFNLLRTMKLSKKEVLKKVLCNNWFLVTLMTLLSLQVLVVQFGKGFFLRSKKLNEREWASCFFLAAISLIIDSITGWLLSRYPLEDVVWLWVQQVSRKLR